MICQDSNPGVHTYSRHCELPQNSRLHMNHVPYRGPTDFCRHRKKLRHCDAGALNLLTLATICKQQYVVFCLFSQQCQFKYEDLFRENAHYKGRYESHASFFFHLNVAPGRVCYLTHMIATLSSSTRIIGAPFTYVQHSNTVNECLGRIGRQW